MLKSVINTITPKRLRNMLRCRLSYWQSLTGRIRIKHYPTFISVEPANFCFLSCPECAVGIKRKNADEKHFFQEEQLQKIIDEIGVFLTTIIFHFQGEPLLNRSLPQLIKLAHQAGIYTMFSTNAQLLTAELARQIIASGVDKIIVSIDGFTEETYQQYRVGGNLQKALDGLKFLAQAKKIYNASTCIELQCLRLKTNEGQWDWLRKNYKSLGADKLSLKTAQFINFKHGNRLMPSNQRYSRYRRMKNGLYERKKAYFNHCFRLWSGCVIDTDGNVLPCCFDKNHKHTFGNIQNQSFRDIWFGETANNFRQKLLKNRKQIKICLNCTE